MNVALPAPGMPARNILSLCAGVGGLELGIMLALASRGEAGRGICYVEREAAAAASLVASMEAGWFHPAPVWSDLATFDGKPWRGLVHILASGDPCQDNSVAGKRAGADGERFLAPEVCRIAKECRPRRIFRENVTGNADGQLHALVPPLEGLGYRIAAGIFSSAETGNTMRRERMFVMAERHRVGLERLPQCDLWPTPRQQPSRRDDIERRSAGMDGTASSKRRAIDDSCRSGGKHTLPQRQEGPDGAGSADAGMGGPAGPRSLPGAQSRTGRADEGAGARNAEPERRGEPVAGAGGPRPQGDQFSGSSRSQHGLLSSRPTAEFRGISLPPAVIPGPSDNSGWIDVLDRFPEYQPALSEEEAQSHLRRGIDAMAHRIERLRATGNGVDPMVAAYAYLSLDALLAGQRTETGGAVLMERVG